MDAPEIPSVWPDDFPPTDPVKKFFYGIRWLGPDISFFKGLRRQQALRNEKLLSTYGPKFQDFDDMGFEEATIDFERRVERRFSNGLPPG
jgi:hypothetical protein